MQSRKVAVSPEEELRIGATIAFPNVLRNLGVNPDKVLSEIGSDFRNAHIWPTAVHLLTTANDSCGASAAIRR